MMTMVTAAAATPTKRNRMSDYEKGNNLLDDLDPIPISNCTLSHSFFCPAAGSWTWTRHYVVFITQGQCRIRTLPTLRYDE